MLSAPYPVPRLVLWQVTMIIGWLSAAGAGIWILIKPPISYEGIDLALTTAWGLMLATGSTLCMAAHIIRSYRVELPGLTLALGGIVVYDYLSWSQTLTTAPGSGPRAMILLLIAALLLARIQVLIFLDRQARHLVEMREPTE